MTPKNCKNRNILGAIALIISIIFFGLGLYFPLFSTATKVIFKFHSNAMNLFDSIIVFFSNSEYFLAIIILIFTIIMPILKYIELVICILWNKTIKPIRSLDKWNMLDVFLVALLLLNFKMNSIFIVMELKIGTTFIALAVIFRIVSVSLIKKDI